jgi:hypothetical protein
MTVKRKISEECRGCFSNNFSTCTKMYYYKNGKCPCGTCLIKIMCNNSCREHDIFWSGMDVATYYKNNRPKGELL